MTARLTELFEGTAGATIVAGGNISSVSGTPTYSSTSPLEGATSMNVNSGTASEFVTVALSPGTVIHSGSFRFRMDAWTSGTANLLRFADASNASLGSISLTAGPAFALIDGAGTAQATSTTPWAVGTDYRVDWEYDATVPTAPVVTLRIFTAPLGSTPIETISATMPTALTLARWLIGHPGASSAAWGATFDQLRIADGLEWLGPLIPGGPGRGLKYHMNRKAGTLNASDLPTLEAVGAANVWAGTAGLELVGALNVKAGNVRPHWKGLAGVLNQLAGTTSFEVDEAAARIP